MGIHFDLRHWNKNMFSPKFLVVFALALILVVEAQPQSRDRDGSVPVREAQPETGDRDGSKPVRGGGGRRFGKGGKGKKPGHFMKKFFSESCRPDCGEDEKGFSILVAY